MNEIMILDNSEITNIWNITLVDLINTHHKKGEVEPNQ